MLPGTTCLPRQMTRYMEAPWVNFSKLPMTCLKKGRGRIGQRKPSPIDEAQNCFVVLRSFSSSVLPKVYAR